MGQDPRPWSPSCFDASSARRPEGDARLTEKTDPSPPFWRVKTLEAMSEPEWESLCDGCARCCLVKLEDEDTRKIHYTDLGCTLLDGKACRCRDYPNRKKHVHDCVKRCGRCPGCRSPAPIGLWGKARTSRGGIRWSRDRRKLFTKRACRSGRASRRARTTCRRTNGSITSSSGRIGRPAAASESRPFHGFQRARTASIHPRAGARSGPWVTTPHL